MPQATPMFVMKQRQHSFGTSNLAKIYLEFGTGTCGVELSGVKLCPLEQPTT